ncbi:Calx-beta domain-containing protein [Lentzea kentuckyensis]|uniref:Calx-beta domain-containing protein n=1 Tax=Lentzea kentuckyensis TaxID=360086 RepID=UPI000A3A38DB|nr:Calx-beta domain-containing protein [Lentzea kentuckyensis]
MKTIMVLLLLLLGTVPAHGVTDYALPDCPIVVDAIDGPVHESTEPYAALVKLRECETKPNVEAMRNDEANRNVEVSYRFVDGTAKQGEDYRAPQSGTVTIKAGQTYAEVPYTVLRVTEEKKQFTLRITAVKPGQVGKAVAVFTIAGRS